MYVHFVLLYVHHSVTFSFFFSLQRVHVPLKELLLSVIIGYFGTFVSLMKYDYHYDAHFCITVSCLRKRYTLLRHLERVLKRLKRDRVVLYSDS
jgi:hypothetical protein